MECNVTQYVEPSDDHYVNRNKREWTAEQVTEFIKDELDGRDPARPLFAYVLIKKPKAAKVTKGGIILPESARTQETVHVGKVLDFGRDAFRDKERFPTGQTCRRGDYVFYQAYEYRRIPLKPLPGTTEDDINYELIVIWDDKILTVCDRPDEIYTPRER